MFDPERLMLSFVLFTLIFCFECWLFTPVSTADVPTQTSTEKVQQLPIEKQMQEVFDVIDEQKNEIINDSIPFFKEHSYFNVCLTHQ